MKKTVAFPTLLLAAATLASAQNGYVGFFATTQVIRTNSVSAAGYAAAYNGAPGSSVPGVSWYYELLVAPTNQTTINGTLSGWTAVFEGTNTPVAGRMFGANSPDGQGVLVPGYNSTATANFAVVGWSSNLGSDWNSVFAGRPLSLVSSIGTHGQASWSNTSAPAPSGWDATYASKLDVFNLGPGGWYGISSIATIPLAASAGPYNQVFENNAITSLNLNYYAVPEPASVVLLGLGAASLLILRRRAHLLWATPHGGLC